MSRELESPIKNLLMTEFFGGVKNGVCLQLTPVDSTRPYVELTAVDAFKLARALLEWVQSVAKLRAQRLREDAKEKLEDSSVIEKEIRNMEYYISCNLSTPEVALLYLGFRSGFDESRKGE